MEKIENIERYHGGDYARKDYKTFLMKNWEKYWGITVTEIFENNLIFLFKKNYVYSYCSINKH